MIQCRKCTKIAVWQYIPGSDNWAYCDNCVPRGCPCNYDLDSDEPDRDSLGRELPCCEYDYDENGFQSEGVEDIG